MEEPNIEFIFDPDEFENPCGLLEGYNDQEEFDHGLWLEVKERFLIKFENYKLIFSEKKIIKSTFYREICSDKRLIIKEIKKENKIIIKIMSVFIKSFINPCFIELEMFNEIEHYSNIVLKILDKNKVKENHKSDYDLLSTFLKCFFGEIANCKDKIFIKKLKYPK